MTKLADIQRELSSLSDGEKAQLLVVQELRQLGHDVITIQNSFNHRDNRGNHRGKLQILSVLRASVVQPAFSDVLSYRRLENHR